MPSCQTHVLLMLIAVAASPVVTASTPIAASSQLVGEGAIQMGSPHTRVVTLAELAGVEHVDAFFLAAPPPGTEVTTATNDSGGDGFDIDLYVFNANGGLVGSCATAGTEATCRMPPNAHTLEVTARHGASLHVRVFRA